MARKRNIFNRIFGKKVKLDNSRVKSKELKLGKKKYMVYSCGSEVVVYKGAEVAYNSILSTITFDEWKQKTKKSK